VGIALAVNLPDRLQDMVVVRGGDGDPACRAEPDDASIASK
jgi:hypothetical protein